MPAGQAFERDMKRRDVLHLGGAAVAGMAVGGAPSAEAGEGGIAFDITDPVANMHAAVRMMGSADGTATYGYNRGRLFGMRPKEHARPIADWEGCAARVFKPREDGAYDLGLREWLYFLDMETGKPIDSMVNPYTRENIELTPFRGGGGFNHTFSVHGQRRSGRSEFEASPGPYVYDWMVADGMAYLQIDKFISFPAYYTPDRFPRASTGPVRWEIQVQTLVGRLDQLNDPDRAAVETAEVWIMKNDWMGFMNMGQWAGHHIWRSQGRKALAVGDLPAGFSRRTEEVFPGLLAEVEAWTA